MASITGEGRFTSDYRVVGTDTFPSPSAIRYQVGMQCLFLRSGTAADQVDRVHAQRYMFVADTPQEIDLLDLVGPRIRLLHLKICDGIDAAAWLKLGGAATDPWAEIGDLTLRPGSAINPGGLVLAAAGDGFPVSSGSRMLRMLPSSHAFGIDLLVLGASS